MIEIIKNDFITFPKSFYKQTAIFFISVALAASWLYYHYVVTGWIEYHSPSPWSSSFEQVGLNGIIKNFVILIWRWLDFGRIGVFALLIYFLIVRNRNRNRNTRDAPQGMEARRGISKSKIDVHTNPVGSTFHVLLRMKLGKVDSERYISLIRIFSWFFVLVFFFLVIILGDYVQY